MFHVQYVPFQGTATTLGGWSTLHNACCYGHHDLAKDLLALGMDPSESTLVRGCAHMVVLPRAIWVDVDSSPQCFSVQSVLLHQTLYFSAPQSLLRFHCSLHCVPSCHPYRSSFPAASLLSPTHVIRMQDGLDSFQLAVTAGHANIVMHLVQRHNVRVATPFEVSTAL